MAACWCLLTFCTSEPLNNESLPLTHLCPALLHNITLQCQFILPHAQHSLEMLLARCNPMSSRGGSGSNLCRPKGLQLSVS